MGHNILAYRAAIEWLWVGFGVVFYTFHPLYTASEFITGDDPLLVWLVTIVFAVTELMAFLSNRHLASLLQLK